MPSNRAAWQDAPGVKLSIRPTPYPTALAPTQILLRVHAWAINPADHMIQDTAAVSFVTYPVILGEDIAGVVVSVGSAAAARFKPNDRVLAMTTGVTNPEMGGFQDYVITEPKLACHIPDFMSFAEASVFPLGVTTPSHGLFSKDFLGLSTPKIDPVSIGRSVLVWGGSSAVGSNAIQLAKAAGFEVFTTASPRNFEYVKSLGASKTFDYSSDNIMADVVEALDQSDCAGIFQAAGSVEPCLQIAERAKADLFVVTSNFIPEDKVPKGVRAKMVFGNALESEDVSSIFADFLPTALAQHKYLVAPEPLILGTKGLEGIQEGLDTLRNGVSAKKVVVVAE